MASAQNAPESRGRNVHSMPGGLPRRCPRLGYAPGSALVPSGWAETLQPALRMVLKAKPHQRMGLGHEPGGVQQAMGVTQDAPEWVGSVPVAQAGHRPGGWYESRLWG